MNKYSTKSSEESKLINMTDDHTSIAVSRKQSMKDAKEDEIKDSFIE